LCDDTHNNILQICNINVGFWEAWPPLYPPVISTLFGVGAYIK